MKKGIVALLILLALVVVVSPALVGRLAEKSVDEQLQWAATETSELKITSTKFDRGWFSSEGTHRVELGDSAAGQGLKQQLGYDPDDATPALIIDTRLDHGLIPVSSVTRPEGSLMPGLGRAVSTLSIESATGEITKLPGVIYSSLELDGGLTSHYFLDKGSMNDMSWGSGELKLTSDSRVRQIGLHGGFDSFKMISPDQNTYSVGNIELSSDMTMTDYGYAVGDMAFAIASVNIGSGPGAVSMGPFKMDATTSLDGSRINGHSTIDFAMNNMPPLGDVAWSIDASMRGIDASAIGRVQRAIDSVPDDADSQLLYAAVERDLMDLAASGFELQVDRFDVTLPQGTVYTKFTASLPESDRQSFVWTGALLGLDASFDIRLPGELYELAAMMNPQIGAAVAMGFLKKNGDDYEMSAAFRKGLLTVNGAPMPIPLPGS